MDTFVDENIRISEISIWNKHGHYITVQYGTFFFATRHEFQVCCFSESSNTTIKSSKRTLPGLRRQGSRQRHLFITPPLRVVGVPAGGLYDYGLRRGGAEERENVDEPVLRKCHGGGSQVKGTTSTPQLLLYRT